MKTADRLVLLGEPDPATSELYGRALRSAFEVIALSDGDAILQELRARSPAALVLEPAIFADHAWERLAAISRTCAERGIALVICSTQDERRRGVELGAVYLVKPTLPTVLVDAVLQLAGS